MKDSPNFNPKVTEGEIAYLAERLSGALWGTLESPNNYDPNGENANVVDGLFSIARAIRYLADTLKGKP